MGGLGSHDHAVSDERLRGALRREAEDLGGAGGDRTAARHAVVAGVRRHHRRRLQAVGAGAAACVVAVAALLVVGSARAPSPPVASSSAPTGRVAAHPRAGGAGGSGPTASSAQAPAHAPSRSGFTPEKSGAPANRPPGTSPVGYGAASGAAATPGSGTDRLNPLALVPPPAHVGVGRRLTLHLPDPSSVRWSTPVPASGSSAAARGALRRVAVRRAPTGGVAAATWVGEHLGAVTLVAHGTCRTPSATAGGCADGRATWRQVVQVEPEQR